MQLLLLSIVIVAACAMVKRTTLESYLILGSQIVILHTNHLRCRQNLPKSFLINIS